MNDKTQRLYAARLIRMIGSARLLPPPLAACHLIIPLINADDMPDLFLLVWRCMHHALANSNHRWESPKFAMRAGMDEGAVREHGDDVGANEEEPSKDVVSMGKAG